MPAYEHEVELAREEGVEIRFLVEPGRDRRQRPRRGRRLRADAARRAGRERPAPAGGRSRAASSSSPSTRSSRRSASGRGDRVSPARVRSHVRRRARPHRNPKIFAAGDAINGGASVVQAVREAKRAARALDGRLAMKRAHRDPLARPRRAGREDGGAAARPCAASLRQERAGVSRVRPGAPGRSAPRLHPRRRAADPPARHDHRPGSRRRPRALARARDRRGRRPRAGRARARQRRGAAGRAGRGFRALRAGDRLAGDGARASSTCSWSAPQAPRSAQPPLDELQDAAVEVLGRKVRRGSSPRGRGGGIRMGELSAWQELPPGGIVVADEAEQPRPVAGAPGSGRRSSCRRA